LTDARYQQLLLTFDEFTPKNQTHEKLNFNSLELSMTGLIELVPANPQTLIYCLNTDPLPARSSLIACERQFERCLSRAK
jgi:hypothetical protein